MPDDEFSVVRVSGILLATFPAQVTDRSVTRLQEEILSSFENHRPEGVVLDISSVSVMDSFFARAVTDTADMVQLMGGDTVVVGMQPNVAITAAELGYDLGTATTVRTTDQAFELLGVGGEPAHGNGQR